MKTLLKTGFGILLVILMIVGLGACPTDTESSDSAGRTPVKDGVYTATASGKSTSAQMTVTTTFANNTLIDISIGANGETGPFLDAVKTLMVPRIVESQSLGVDAIAGATFTSVGVKQAVSNAIDEAGGVSSEWYTELSKNSGTVKLTGYDVVVVGLGGSGTAAYLKASEAIDGYYPAVYGIEVGGKIGGNTATVGGPLATNSEYIKSFYSIGNYVDEEALLQQWYADMGADVPAGFINKQDFVVPYGGMDYGTFENATGKTYPLPQVTAQTRVPEYQGGPKWKLIELLVNQSGETVDWLGGSYNFHFNKPSGLSFPQYQIVINYGSDVWQDGAYTYDGFNNLYKTSMFTRALEMAKAKNPRSGYKLELRGTDLIMSEGKAVGVKATYIDGTKYEIYGKTVILATGGFIGNREMKLEHYGSDLRSEAVDTERGDGIRMALAQGAAPYNLDMPAVTHIAAVKNIVREQVFSDAKQDARYKSTITSMLLKQDGMVIGLKGADVYDLDYRGKRFSNEGPTLFALDGLDFQNWMVGGYFAAIFSNDEIARIKNEGLKFSADTIFWMVQGELPVANTPIADLDAILEEGKRHGNVIQAANLGDFARLLGEAEGTTISEATLKDSITRYNGFVDAAQNAAPTDPSKDEDFRKPNQYLVTKVTPDCSSGYTAILGAGYYYSTTGGLDVNENIQVLNTSKSIIPGLYAVGQDSSGVLYNAKKAYVGYGAAAQGWAVTSGRLAGEHAAKTAKAAN